MLDSPRSLRGRAPEGLALPVKEPGRLRSVTGRPPWSGGEELGAQRRSTSYESEEMPASRGTSHAHLLRRLFLRTARTDPLWMSEGMATVRTGRRGLSEPNWLRENLAASRRWEALPFESFMGVSKTSGWTARQGAAMVRGRPTSARALPDQHHDRKREERKKGEE